MPPARALIYDVHGNLPALDAVLADARNRGVQAYLLGGDYALFGPWPAETLAALRALEDAIWIRGNVDRWCAQIDVPENDDTLAGALEDCRLAIGESAAEQLGGLVEQITLEGIRFCHASPKSDMESFFPEPTDDEDALLEGVAERRVVFGHTHLQFRRSRPDGAELINPGSVGLPLDGDHRAAYAILDRDGSIELRRVAYDHEASAQAVRDLFGDAAWAVRSQRRLLEARP